MRCVFLSQTYTCPLNCVLEELNFLNEEGYPDMEAIGDLFENTPMGRGVVKKWDVIQIQPFHI